MINYERIKMEEIQNPERFTGDTSFLDDAVAYATGKVWEVMGDFVHSHPDASSINLMYEAVPNTPHGIGVEWVAGFWTGLLWLSYELTGNEVYRAVAEAQLEDYKNALKYPEEFHHHDIGFLFVPSTVAQYKVTGSQRAKKVSLKAAKLLAKRFCRNAGIIQVRNRDAQGNFIIDCSMNVPLLFWASTMTQDREFFYKAYSHLAQAARCMVRDDASTYQCYKIDELTGEPVRGWQGQGHDDDSCWARGQVWIMYGMAIGYRYTKDEALLEIAKRTSNYYLNRLPSDLICNWDLMFTEDDVQRDSSSAPVAACALLELEKYLDDSDPLKEIYHNAAVSMMRSLAETYTTKGLHSNGLLQHGVYCKDKGSGGLGDDECCMWGDYFYMEALARLKKDWNMYW